MSAVMARMIELTSPLGKDLLFRSLHGRESHAFHLEHVLWRRLVEEDPVTPLRVGGVRACESGAERCRTDLSIERGPQLSARDALEQSRLFG